MARTRANASACRRLRTDSGTQQVGKLGDIGHLFEPIDPLDQPLDLLARQGMRRCLAVAPELLEVVVPAQRLGRIAQDDIEPCRVAGAVTQVDLDLDGVRALGSPASCTSIAMRCASALRLRVAIRLRV